MTVSTTSSKVSYAGNGSTTAFAVSFYFLANADLKVTLRSAAGVETVRTLGTDYSVTGAGVPSGGTVTMTVAPAAGTTLVVSRNAPLTQTVDYQPNDPFPANTHEQALDKLTMITQQIQEQVDRSAKLPITSAADANALVADIERIADSADNVDTVANNISSVNTNATNITAIQNAATNAATATTQAGIATTQAGIATTQAGIATTQAGLATTQAGNAANSAALAAASAASGLYSAVIDKSANYTVVAGDAGDLIRVSTGSGAVTITLPQISTLSDGYKVAIVKWTGDSNAVTVARSGSDTINGATSAQIGAQYTQITFVADFETNQWFAATSGLGSTNVVVDRFNGNNSTVAFTLSGDPGALNNTYVFVAGVYQQKNTYSVSGTTITFTQAPPSGTGNVEVVWTQPLPVGVPSDGTVTAAKMAAGAAAGNLGFTPVNKAGDSLTGSLGVRALLETATITAAAPSATTNYDAIAQSVQYYTTNNANNWTLNVRGNSTTTLNTMLAIGQSVTIALMTTNGATPFYMTAIQVDGVGQTIRWQGGSAPTSGNASAVDVYAVTIIKTAASTYTVLASQTQFK